MNLQQARSAVERYKRKEQQAKRSAEQQGARIMSALLTVGGAAAGGALDGSMLKKAEAHSDYTSATTDEEREEAIAKHGTLYGVDPSLAVGGLAALAGVADLADDYSDSLLDLGAGMLAAYTGRKLHEHTSKPDTAAA